MLLRNKLRLMTTWISLEMKMMEMPKLQKLPQLLRRVQLKRRRRKL
jgi:hypothetical protein